MSPIASHPSPPDRSPSDRRPSDWSPLSALAPLLVYPNADLPLQVAFCREHLAAVDPALLGIAAPTLDFLESRPLYELEEFYTRTFDLNPVCTLEVGWHLYGEQYERGRFLARMRDLLRVVGQDEGGELPDFLPSLLCALARLPREEMDDLAAALLSAVGKMCAALEGKDNPYQALLAAVSQALEARVPEEAVERAQARFRSVTRPVEPDLVQLGSQKGWSS